MWNGATYDCQRCGACCARPRSCEGSAYAYVTRKESKQMKRLGLSVIQEDGYSYLGTRISKNEVGPAVCVAFSGEVGEGCGCSIYQDRPGVCRAFLVGSTDCLIARQRAGLEI
jgi:Fe-S-cluster containining protein